MMAFFFWCTDICFLFFDDDMTLTSKKKLLRGGALEGKKNPGFVVD